MEYKQIWRFYIDRNDEEVLKKSIELSEDEAHFAYSVLRLKTGDEVELADGHGWTGHGLLTRVDKKVVSVVIEKEILTQKKEKNLVALVGITKPGALDEVVQVCVESGVDHLFLFKGDRTSSKQEIKIEKLTKQIREFCRITKSPWCLRVSLVNSLQAAVLAARDEYRFSKLLVCDERPSHDASSLQDKRQLFREAQSLSGSNVGYIVGPEASFSSAEYQFLNDEEKNERAVYVSLGPRILRTPAAVAAASYLLIGVIEAGDL